MSQTVLYIGASIITLLGIVHFVSTKIATKEYAILPSDLQKEHLVQWTVVGLALVFVGVTTLLALVMGNSDTKTFSIIVISLTVFTTAIAVTGTIIYRKSKMMPHKIVTGVLIVISILYILGAIF